MSLSLTVNAAGRTHVGLVRARNEDALHVGRYLVAVADGLGGHLAGDVASTTVIETVRPYDRLVDPHNHSATLGRAVSAANGALRRRIQAEPELAGMASTLVAMLWSESKVAVANVGDSRAYLLRSGDDTLQITEDHTYEHLLANAAQVPTLPVRLSRFLDGRKDGRSPDINTWDVRPDDRFLLCSDGLSSFVRHERIHAALSSAASVDEAADQLVTLALNEGGPDNITVVVVDVRGDRTARD